MAGKNTFADKSEDAVAQWVWVFVVDCVLRPFHSARRTLPRLSASGGLASKATFAPADNFCRASPHNKLTSYLGFHAADFAIFYCRILAHDTLQ